MEVQRREKRGEHLYIYIYIIREYRPLSLDRVGSRSRRLSESPLTPPARYGRRPCLCRIRCPCRSSDFFILFVKNVLVVGLRSCEGNSANNAGCCYGYTIVSVPRIARPYTMVEGNQGTREARKRQGMYPEEGTGQFTLHTPSHNAALALETLVLQMKNSEHV